MKRSDTDEHVQSARSTARMRIGTTVCMYYAQHKGMYSAEMTIFVVETVKALASESFHAAQTNSRCHDPDARVVVRFMHLMLAWSCDSCMFSMKTVLHVFIH